MGKVTPKAASAATGFGASGAALTAAPAVWRSPVAIISSPELVSGQTYTLQLGSFSGEVTAD